MNKLILLILALGLAAAPACWAKNAEIMLLPTRVVMEKDDHTSTVVIKNAGDAPGVFHIDLIDMKMEETGMVVPYASGETPQYSAIPYISMSPRSTALKPGESQNVRLMLHKPENLAAGEYRAHLRVRLAGDNLVIVIPVIIRNGDTTLAVAISQPKLSRDKDGAPAVEMYLNRQGNRSAMGDVAITCATSSGPPQVIKVFPGVAVYRPTAKRFISVPLDETPKNINPSACKFGVTYALQQKDGGGALAQAPVGN